MAKIEKAFSLEINDFVDAIEANELWMEGVLKDKKAFICVGENCYAGITCKNMDTFASDRKPEKVSGMVVLHHTVIS